ncbi:MAG: helix-turn-helix domain-containing protein [Rhodobacteraceae bacterium]|nr:helix-turn-helix domain-containing protein [Paracoccaceae bacterium]
MIIRKLRLNKGWSQEHLAEISGVSTRTIQRIERGKTASLESLKCLAAVFETNITTLREDDPMTDTQPQTPEISNADRAALAKMKEWMQHDEGYLLDPSLNDDERAAMEYVRDIKAFYINFWSYAIVMAGLLIINLLTGPDYIWVVWPALGWGIGVLMHGLTVFERFSFFGTEWERKQVEKRLRRK